MSAPLKSQYEIRDFRLRWGQKDIMESQPSELESQTGALVRMGCALDMSTTTHEFIYASLLSMELKARGK